MGDMLVKTTEEQWTKGQPFVRTATGQSRARFAYRKIIDEAGDPAWVEFWRADSTAPGVPTNLKLEVSGFGGFNITVTAPYDTDVMSLRVKVGKIVPSNNTLDSAYLSTMDGSDPAWSEWMVAPGQTRTKKYPPSGSLVSGTTYYVSVWAQDTSRNFSAPATKSIVYKSLSPTTTVTRSTYITTVDSTTFSKEKNIYNRTDKLVRTGHPNNNHGIWYYGDKISALLQGASRINDVKIEIQRLASSPSGIDQSISTATRFKFFGHNMTTWSNIDIHDPSRIVFAGELWGTYGGLERGQSKVYTVPSAIWPMLLSGKLKGFGVYTNVSASPSVDMGTYYGFGTNSGRLFISYTS